MCDIRLFRSAKIDHETAGMILNNAAYHLQQAVEKTLKGSLECTGVTVPKTNKISKLIKMVSDNGAAIKLTEWIDDHSEMLSEWEAETRYDMDFLVEKRKLDAAMSEVGIFLVKNGICDELREELREPAIMKSLLACLPKNKRDCSDLELNGYYIMFKKKIEDIC